MRLFLLLSVLLVASAQAQTGGVESVRTPVRVQRTGGSSGVSGVRQRIRALQGQPQRVVQPVIVVVSPPAAPQPLAAPQPQARALPAPLTTEERQALDQVRPGLGDRLQMFYDAYQPYTPPVIVHLPPGGDTPPAATPPDSVAVADTSASGGILPPPQPSTPPAMPRAPVPSLREVERAMLETGLFRAAGVNFEFDKSRLLEGSEVFLDPVGEVLRQYPNLRVEVGGHTDNIGTQAYNQKLSQARAETVRQYLIRQYDLDPARIVARGYGENSPIVTNDNPTGRTINRRVEFTVLAR